MNMVAGKVVIISATDTFLAKSIMTKLGRSNILSEFVHAELKEIGKHVDNMWLAILFMSEEMVEVPEVLVYLKNIIKDKEIGFFLIGDEEQFDFVTRTIPKHDVTEWFKRPLDIELLTKRVCQFRDAGNDSKGRKTILIVDDDITYLRTVYEWLKDSYHVGMASSGVQAISYLAKNKADLILLDYEMPIANGPQVLSMLKNDSETEQIPVMFLTGHSDKESVMSVVELKPVDYLLKTIDKDMLLKKLKDFFSKKTSVKM